jgi:circadian clock protein KaiC
MVERVATGVEGLDELVGGGLPEGCNILTIGGPGAGKSILATQYLVFGAMNGENGVYLTCDETKNKLVKQALDFGWDLAQLEKEKKVIIQAVEEQYDIETILELLGSDVKKIKAKRLVVDSISMLGVYSKVVPEAWRNPVKKLPRMQRFIEDMKRPQIVAILQTLSSFGTTNIVIAEEDGGSTIPEYAADGVIRLHQKIMGSETNRSLAVEKMRSSKIKGGIHKFEFGEGGIIIK